MRRLGQLLTRVTRAYRGAGSTARRGCIGLIRVYQRTAPYRPRVCRFVPTCSEYTVQAIARYGVPKGVVLGCWRVMRCNPFNKGGYDPVK